MTITRCAAGLAAVITAMLVQAALVGPLVYPVPVSLPLLLVVGVAVLCGPSTGVPLGFGAGLFADLNSEHPVGLFALAWLGAGLVAGVVGGLVSGDASAPRRTGPRRRPRGRMMARPRRPLPLAAMGTSGVSPWRAQAMLTGLIAVAATAVGFGLQVVVGQGAQISASTVVLLIPAGLLDAILAVALLIPVRAVLKSAALRPVVPVRLGVEAAAPTWPMDLR